ncbi:hypothetical protein CRENBAI_001557 [Crenichthys baileyi]|uniref:Ig-like domain-containing protein n=1 Tax=Crenichthys baileyi TaxID=28760 RepID=A0AAV9RNT2_9TELE
MEGLQSTEPKSSKGQVNPAPDGSSSPRQPNIKHQLRSAICPAQQHPGQRGGGAFWDPTQPHGSQPAKHTCGSHQINIKAEPGQTVTLPCGPPDNNSPVTSNVRTEDSGIYECSVIQKGDKKTWKRDTFDTEPIRIINLSVGSAPDEGMRNDEGNNAGGNDSGPVDQIDITAEPGQSITLPCRASNKIIIAVEWRRADLNQYVLRYRDGQLDPENQHPSYTNRVDLQDRQTENGDVSLVLKNVRTNDTGIYKCTCRVDGSTEEEHVCSITLDVSPHPPFPGGADGQKRNGYTAAVVLLGSLLVSISDL